MQAYALSPACPVYTGPGASPTQATGEPFTADSPYFPFSARPAKAKITPGLRPTKDEPQAGSTTTDNQQWGVVSQKEQHFSNVKWTLFQHVISERFRIEISQKVQFSGIQFCIVSERLVGIKLWG